MRFSTGIPGVSPTPSNVPGKRRSFKSILEELESRGPLTEDEVEQLVNSTAMREAKRLEKFRKSSLASTNVRISEVLKDLETSGISGGSLSQNNSVTSEASKLSRTSKKAVNAKVKS